MKQPTRKRRPIPKIAFRAIWDANRRRYVAVDDDGALLGLSPDKNLAMGIAHTAALNAARDRVAAVSVMVEDDRGKFKTWESFAPGKAHG